MADGFLPLTKEALQTDQGINELNRMLNILFQNIPGDTEKVIDIFGYGTPNGQFTADIGATYRQLDGSTGTTFWVKEGNGGTATGWSAVS